MCCDGLAGCWDGTTHSFTATHAKRPKLFAERSDSVRIMFMHVQRMIENVQRMFGGVPEHSENVQILFKDSLRMFR